MSSKNSKSIKIWACDSQTFVIDPHKFLIEQQNHSPFDFRLTSIQNPLKMSQISEIDRFDNAKNSQKNEPKKIHQNFVIFSTCDQLR